MKANKWLSVQLFLLLGIYQAVISQTVQPAFPAIFGQMSNVRDFTLSPDRKTLFFTLETYGKDFSAILVVHRKGKGWGKPQVAPFSGKYKDLEPFSTPDGNWLYFVSNRPKEPEGEVLDMDIWRVQKLASGEWSVPQRMGPEINTEKNEYYPSLAQNGNLYFTRESDQPARKEDIYRAEWDGNQYLPAVPLSDAVNGNTYEYNAYITPAEDAIIYTSYGRKEEMGGSDLYINHRLESGEWGPAIHLGGINSGKIDYCPWWEPETQTLYFTSERSAIPKVMDGPKDIKELTEQIDQYSNGLGRIYQVPFPIPYSPEPVIR